MIVAYGVSILTISENLMETAKYKEVEEFTGMQIDKINIFAEGVRWLIKEGKQLEIRVQ